MISPAVRRLLFAKGLRAFGDGFVSLLLPVYLLQLGFSALQVGIIATATLLGSGVLTLAVGLHAYRYHYRTLLLAATVLMAGTGLGFAVVTDFWPLLLIAVVGTLNPSSGDVSVFLPLEHAVLSRVVSDADRTAIFARYSVVGALLAAAGSLAVGLPAAMSHAAGWTPRGAMQAMFVLYGLLGGATALAYRGLPRQIESDVRRPSAPLGRSKKVVYTLAALFSLDFTDARKRNMHVVHQFDLCAQLAADLHAKRVGIFRHHDLGRGAQHARAIGQRYRMVTG